MTKTTRPQIPSISGIRVRKEDHANMTPPQETGMRNEVVDAIRKWRRPSQSAESCLQDDLEGDVVVGSKGA